jgi:hypothetical protein
VVSSASHISARGDCLRWPSMGLSSYCWLRLPQGQIKTQTHITSDGQWDKLAWCQASSGAQDDLCFSQTVSGLKIWGALSEEGTCLSFVIVGCLQRSHLPLSKPVIHLIYIYGFTCIHSTQLSKGPVPCEHIAEYESNEWSIVMLKFRIYLHQINKNFLAWRVWNCTISKWMSDI